MTRTIIRSGLATLLALCGVAALCSNADALVVDVGGVNITFECSEDHLTQKDGTELGGEEQPIEIVSISREKIEYRFSGATLSAQIAKVADVCFGNASRAFTTAVEAYEAREFAVAAKELEAAAAERGPQSVWAPQIARYLAGLAYLAAGDAAGAERVLTQLKRDVPSSICIAQVDIELVRIKVATGDLEGSLKLLDEVLAGRDLAESDRFEFLLLRGDLLMSLQRWGDAEQTLKDAESMAGRFDAPTAKRARTRIAVLFGKVWLGRGDLQRATDAADRVLDSSTFDNADEHEARAMAISLLGEICIKQSELASGDPAKVRTWLEQALENYLKVISIYGGDEGVDRQVRGMAFQRVAELAGPNRLNDKNVFHAGRNKADRHGF